MEFGGGFQEDWWQQEQDRKIFSITKQNYFIP